jgi:hypothetical protein
VLKGIGAEDSVKGTVCEGQGFGVCAGEVQTVSLGATQAAVRNVGSKILPAIEKPNAIGGTAASDV